jgi:hypothetical protein
MRFEYFYDDIRLTDQVIPFQKKEKNKILEKFRLLQSKTVLEAQNAGYENKVRGAGFKMKC